MRHPSTATKMTTLAAQGSSRNLEASTPRYGKDKTGRADLHSQKMSRLQRDASVVEL